MTCMGSTTKHEHKVSLFGSFDEQIFLGGLGPRVSIVDCRGDLRTSQWVIPHQFRRKLKYLKIGCSGMHTSLTLLVSGICGSVVKENEAFVHNLNG